MSAQTTRPLLVEGKSTVYQRVLTRPGATLHAAPDAPAIRTYPAFQPLYVFGRQGDWLQVGPAITSPPEGFVPTASAVEWRQNIVGAFTNSAGRSRQLLFDSQDSLRWLMNHEALREIQARLLAEADAGTVSGADGVVSVEPPEFVNIRDDLYVMPILDFVEDLHPLTYEDVLLMEVASVPLNAAAPSNIQVGASDPFDVGIVFVLDTTQSMQPYIESTQRVLQNVVRQIQGTEIGELVNFGAIGFRDSTEAAPGLEYRTKTLIDMSRRNDQSPVLAAIGAATDVARVSSPGFNEDALAGVEDAIDEIDWEQNGDPVNARYVILVTDAGPKDPRDPNARSQIGVQELQRDAEGRSIVIMTLHLKTSVGGEANHGYAESRYRELSRFAGNGYYFPIEGGSEESFEAVATRLVTAITDHVRVAQGQATVLSPDETGQDLLDLGRAMRLAYLGDQRNTQAPDVLTGWISDRAVENPAKQVVEPRLLISKNELATMAELLEKIITLAESGNIDPNAFFDQVRVVVVEMSTDPSRVLSSDVSTLSAPMEFLDSLPYQSQLSRMTPERWQQSALIRQQITDGLRQKLTQYRKWLFDDTVWTALYENAPDGERVFAMPFDALP